MNKLNKRIRRLEAMIERFHMWTIDCKSCDAREESVKADNFVAAIDRDVYRYCKKQGIRMADFYANTANGQTLKKAQRFLRSVAQDYRKAEKSAF